MIELMIDYHKKTFAAVITISKSCETWHDIRRVLQESTPEVVNLDEHSLKLPWWAFLNSKDRLAYHLRKNHVKLIVSASAEAFLAKSNQKKCSYFEATENQSPANDLNQVLNQAGFKRLLTSEQIRNLTKTAKLPAAATFSVPGAGKTTEAIAYFFYNRKPDSKLLLVAPKNAFPAWDEQLSECTDEDINVVRLVGSHEKVEQLLQKHPPICIVTYHKLPNILGIVSEYLLTGENNFMFLDESHRIKKGRSGEHGRAVLNLCHIPTFKLIMSGTPIPNSPFDMNPQFEFLYPEIRVNDNANDLIQPVFVRTTKNELGLPPLKRHSVEIDMTSEQTVLYRLLTKDVLSKSEIALNSLQRNAIRDLRKYVVRLLQLVSNPSLLIDANIDHQELLTDILSSSSSVKIDYVCNRARVLAKNGSKTLIWTTFVKNVELIKSRLSDLGAECIHGGVDTGNEDENDSREGIIKRFHDDDNCLVLIATPASCSEGISLHRVCHNAIYLDRNFNAAQYLQSEDRIHRYGLNLDQETHIEIVKCPGTIDDAVERRLNLKVDLMGKVLNDPNLDISPININEAEDDEFLDKGDILEIIEQIRKLL
jgi:SNF2 family DNA or RNA helicase